MNTLYKFYQDEGKKKLAQSLSIKNMMAVPQLLKIVVSVGLGEALSNKGAIEAVSDQLTRISGQKTIVTKARQDIATFKLRKGDAVGVKVTLRGARMYDFLEKLVKIVLPRIRDFKGVSTKSFDSFGNYTLGLSEQIVFGEIEYDTIDKVRGMEITFVTSASDAKEARALLTLFGMPFEKEGRKRV